jgi:hypothetical protein
MGTNAVRHVVLSRGAFVHGSSWRAFMNRSAATGSGSASCRTRPCRWPLLRRCGNLSAYQRHGRKWKRYQKCLLAEWNSIFLHICFRRSAKLAFPKHKALFGKCFADVSHSLKWLEICQDFRRVNAGSYPSF